MAQQLEPGREPKYSGNSITLGLGLPGHRHFEKEWLRVGQDYV
jgi:hypothetical protein